MMFGEYKLRSRLSKARIVQIQRSSRQWSLQWNRMVCSKEEVSIIERSCRRTQCCASSRHSRSSQHLDRRLRRCSPTSAPVDRPSPSCLSLQPVAAPARHANHLPKNHHHHDRLRTRWHRDRSDDQRRRILRRRDACAVGLGCVLHRCRGMRWRSNRERHRTKIRASSLLHHRTKRTGLVSVCKEAEVRKKEGDEDHHRHHPHHRRLRLPSPSFAVVDLSASDRFVLRRNGCREI